MKKDILPVIPTLKSAQSSLRQKIKFYLQRSMKMQEHLNKYPNDWGRYQNEFNREVNLIFNEILHFVKAYEKTDSGKVDKLKDLFIQRFRGIFLNGVYNKWSLNKPYGYAGDFKIIDEIYQNNPPSDGFERLFDNYFLTSSISVAVRNRKEDFKRIIVDVIKRSPSDTIRIMNLACGPCREIKELYSDGELKTQKKIIFDCYDHDDNAINYAKNLLKGVSNVNFYKENALKVAAAKNVKNIIDKEYDIIYSTGLFDYLNYKVSVKLLSNLRKLLKSEGVLAVADVRDKFNNPSVFYMEWIGDWALVYNDDENFRKTFIDAGFNADCLKSQYEQQGIIQYVLATNKNTTLRNRIGRNKINIHERAR